LPLGAPVLLSALSEDVERYRNGDDEESEDDGLIDRLSEMSVLQSLEHTGIHRGTSMTS
jgi:hypothetical protein